MTLKKSDLWHCSNCIFNEKNKCIIKDGLCRYFPKQQVYDDFDSEEEFFQREVYFRERRCSNCEHLVYDEQGEYICLIDGEYISADQAFDIACGCYLRDTTERHICETCLYGFEVRSGFVSHFYCAKFTKKIDDKYKEMEDCWE